MDNTKKHRINIRKGIARLGVNLFVLMFALASFSQRTLSAGQTWTYNYTGDQQVWGAPYTGKYKLEVWGAQGGGAYGGNGGYSTGEVNLTSGQILYIYVGGNGVLSVGGGGGYNGGGHAGSYGSSHIAGGGGGATDIRANGSALTNRIIIAGGGGGNGANHGTNNSYNYGGNGGGSTGLRGNSANYGSTYEATQFSGFALGQGGHGGGYSQSGSSVTYGTGGGGGGGYYGGHPGSWEGAGGGSGYIGGVQNGSMQTGVRSGNGYAVITALNNQPSILMSTPTTGQTFSPTVYLLLAGSVNDPDVGQVLKVYYRIDGSAGQAGTQVGSNMTANGANQSYSCSINVGSLSEGNHTLYTWVVDDNNASSAETSTAFIVKKTAPGSGGLSVNSGAQYAKASPLTLTTTASGATKMFISLGNSTAPTSTTGATSGVTTGWIPYSGTYNWNYTGADGNITFYAWYSDAVWNISSSYSDGITFDKTLPTGGSILINRKPDGTGNTYANASPLKLTLNAADAISPSAVKMFISTSSTTPTPTSTATTGVSTGWINYAAAYDWPYTGVDGTVKLNVWYMDAATNITPMYSDDIIFDKTPAAGTVTINAPSGGIYTHTDTTQQEFSVGTAQGTKATSGGDLELDGATSGTYISQILDISGVATAGGSLIGWTEYLPSGTDVRVDTSITFNRGATWTDWTRANKYEAIPGINVGMDLRTVWLKYRITLTSTTLGGTPQFNDVTVSVVSPGAGSADRADVVLSFTKIYSYANVNQIILSNSADFQLSQTVNYADTVNWTLDNSSRGAKTVFAKYVDWAGNTSNYFTSSTVVDNSAPTGSISINGGAASTSQPTVTLTIGASDDTTAQSEIQMMISNREDLAGGVWESFAQNKTWPIDSSASGTKTVYVKFKDKLGNISEPVSASIEYTALTGGTGGTGGGIAYITSEFLNSVQHYQFISVGTNREVLATGPNSPAESLDDSEYLNFVANSLYFNSQKPRYRMAFSVTNSKAALIKDLAVDFDFNDYNEEGISFVIETAELKKNINGSYQTIKYIVPQYLGKNRYIIGLGNDNSGNSIISANGAGEYAIDYTTRVVAVKTPDATSDDAVYVTNKTQFIIYTGISGGSGFTQFIEPERPGRQFNIQTKVSRWDRGAH